MSRINSVDQGNKKTYPFSRWMSCFFMVMSALMLCYTYWKAEISFQYIKGAVYFKYYLISLIGILFWAVVLRLREEIRAKIVIVFTSLVIGLYMVEGGVTLLGLGHANRAASAAAELGVKYDTRTKLEVIEDLIEKGEDAIPTVHVSNIIPIFGANKEDTHPLLPLGGVANKTTVYNNESGKYLIYMSDRHGFNNPDTQWNSQRIEWLIVGDSFAHGSAVQPGEDIAGQIRSITLNDAISLGIGGNGPLVDYAALVEYGNALAPEKVLWMYYPNDLSQDLKKEKKNFLLMRYLEDGFSQNLINRRGEIDSMLEEYISQGKAQLRKDWIKLRGIRNIISFDADADADAEVEVDDPLFVEILTKAKARVESWGGKLYFVYLPEYSRYSQKINSHAGYNKKSEVIDLVKGLNIPVIDIHQEVFADHPDPLSLFPLRIHGHYNKEGYSEVAKAIIANINE